VGAFGVDLFFVVSGFIMWVLTNERRDRRGFVVDRLARVVPAYWCVSVISAAGAALVPRLFLAEGPPSWEHVVTSLLFLPVHYYPVVPQGWTLNIEMFFYALFAATLGLPRRAQLIVLSVMLAGFVLLGMAFHPPGGIGNTYFNTRLLEFIGGLWIGEFWLRGMGTDARLGIGAVLGGLILAPLLQWWRPELITFSWAFPAMLIVAGALIGEQRHAVPRIRIAALTGDASYLIYLIHIPIVQVLVELHWLPVSLLLVTAMLLCIAVSIALLPVDAAGGAAVDPARPVYASTFGR
jgi:exopolysaccharide production protein ExoZ